MNFTFGIITGGQNEEKIDIIIDSIEKQCIPLYEVIIVGKCNIQRKHTHIIPFNEIVKNGWITKKKNIIAKTATYDNIVYLHDYVMLDDDWYTGFCQYNEEFDVIVTKVKNLDGTRYKDWFLFPFYIQGLHNRQKLNYNPNNGCLLPYNVKSNSIINNYILIPGFYFIVKRNVINKFILDENLSWGQGEDVEWCDRLHKVITFKCNPLSTVKFLKQKPACEWEKEI